MQLEPTLSVKWHKVYTIYLPNDTYSRKPTKSDTASDAGPSP